MLEGVPPQLERLLESCERAHMRWSLLRPRELLSQPEGDVDILVEPRERERAREILRSQGFLLMHDGLTDLHALDHDPGSARFIWVHVQTAVTVAGTMLPADAVLDSAEDAPLRQPAASWLFWILVLHDLLDKRAIPIRHRIHLQQLSADVLPAPGPLLRIAGVHRLDAGVVTSLAATGDWNALEALTMRPPSRHHAPFLRLVRRLRSLTTRHQGPPGITVAVVGPDGAGKTTLVNSLHSALPLPTHIQYLGLTGGRMPWADALRVPGVVFTARLAILWWRFLRGAYYRSRGRIVLFERYVLDAAVPSGRQLRPVAAFSRRLQQWVLPLPDLVLLLDASGTTMHRRSGEYDADRLEQWRLAFKRLERSVTQLEVLDAERPAEVVLHDAEDRIWRRYRKMRETL